MASVDIKLMMITICYMKDFSGKKKKPLTYFTAIILMSSITGCTEV